MGWVLREMELEQRLDTAVAGGLDDLVDGGPGVGCAGEVSVHAARAQGGAEI